MNNIIIYLYQRLKHVSKCLMQAMSFEYYRKGSREVSTKPLGHKEEWASLLSLNGGGETIRNKNLNFYPSFLVQKDFVSVIFDRKWKLALDRNQIGESITT